MFRLLFVLSHISCNIIRERMERDSAHTDTPIHAEFLHTACAIRRHYPMYLCICVCIKWILRAHTNEVTVAKNETRNDCFEMFLGNYLSLAFHVLGSVLAQAAKWYEHKQLIGFIELVVLVRISPISHSVVFCNPINSEHFSSHRSLRFRTDFGLCGQLQARASARISPHPVAVAACTVGSLWNGFMAGCAKYIYIWLLVMPKRMNRTKMLQTNDTSSNALPEYLSRWCAKASKVCRFGTSISHSVWMSCECSLVHVHRVFIARIISSNT